MICISFKNMYVKDVHLIISERVKSRNSPAYTIDYKAIPGKKAIDVDLVPCFKIEGWPPVAKRLDPKWISYDSVVHNAMKSCDVVCKKCPHGNNNQ